MATDNQRVLQYSIYALGLVLWYLVYMTMNAAVELIDTFVVSIRVYHLPLFGAIENVTPLLGLAVAFAVAEYVRRQPTANKYGVEVIVELRKVTWPSWKDVRGTTIVVFGVTVVMALTLWVFDKFFETLIKALLRAVS